VELARADDLRAAMVRRAGAAGVMLRLRPPPPEPPATRHLTTLTRLPLDLATEIVEIVHPLVAACSDAYLYPPESVHVTILTLDQLVKSNEDVAADVGAALRAQPSFSMTVRGIGATPATVFASTLSADNKLGCLRKHLSISLEVPRAALARLVVAGLGFANVVRFAGPPPARLGRDLHSLRRREFGSFAVKRVELVRTDRVLAADATEPIEAFDLS
jgi:hypothetical protein